MSNWVLIRSWHRITVVIGHMAHTRCGRWVPIVGHLSTEGGEGPMVAMEIHATASHLPLGEQSCETCLRLIQHDEEQSTTSGLRG